MKIKYNLLLVLLTLIAAGINAQGKYFKVAAIPYDNAWGNDKFFGNIVPVIDQGGGNAILHFGGKSKQQLYEGIMQYLKARPGFLLKPKSTNEHLITYRDFTKVGSIDSCFADLVALTFVYAIPEDGLVKISFGITSKIYATIFNAQLKITPDDNIASVGDLPFNEYKYVQPADESVIKSRSTAHTMLLGSSTGYKTGKRSLKEAYPDSVFDPEGNVVNQVNKRIIENFYDWFAADINAFLQGYFKK